MEKKKKNQVFPLLQSRSLRPATETSFLYIAGEKMINQATGRTEKVTFGDRRQPPVPNCLPTKLVVRGLASLAPGKNKKGKDNHGGKTITENK